MIPYRSRQEWRRLVAGVLGLAVLIALAAAGAAWWHHTRHQPEYRLRRGQEALHRGHDYEADRLALSLEADGYLDHAHLLRGEACLRRLQLNQAITEYNQINRDNEDILVEASAIYGLGFLSLKKAFEAERFLLYVLSQRPDHIEAHRGLARIYYDQGALRLTVGHLRRWADLDPHGGESYRFLGLAYKAMGDANLQAVQAYQEALSRELKPEIREEVAVELAETLIKQTEYTQALQILESCQPESEELQTQAFELRADCLHALGLPEVLPLLDGALRDHPSSVPLLRLRALIHLEAGEPAPAAKLLENALLVDPSDYPCHHLLAQAYESLRRPADATEQRRRVEQIQKTLQELTALNQGAVEKPWDGRVRRRLAALCQKLHRPDLARMWLEAAAACPPEPPLKKEAGDLQPAAALQSPVKKDRPRP